MNKPLNPNDPWAQFANLGTAPDPWEQFNALGAPAAPAAPAADPWTQFANIAAPAPVAPAQPEAPLPTAMDDLRAGLLAARQGGVALTQVAPGIADVAAGNFREGISQELGGQVIDLDTQIAAIEAQLADRSQRALRPQLEAQLIELSNQRNQRGLALGAGGMEAGMAEGARDIARGNQNILEGSARIGELGAQIGAIPSDPRVQAVSDAEGIIGPILAYLEAPGAITRSAILRSLPAMAPTAVAAVGGTALAGPLGGGLAAGGTGAATEYGMSVSQSLQEIFQENGIDPRNEDATAAFLEANPDVFDDVLRNAALRAGIIGTVDAATGGIAGAITRPVAGSSRVRRVGQVAAGAGVEGVGEGAGEGLAQLATEGEVNFGDVLLETVAGVGMGAPQAIGQMAVQAATPAQPGTPPAAPTTPPAVPPTDGVPPAPIAPDSAPQSAAQPAPLAPPAPADANPRVSRVYTPDNQEIETEFRVVEADDLLTSDLPDYPQELQPRDRDRAASEIQIEGIANAPNPLRLEGSPETSNGSPIVGPDGRTVESGNGRTIGLRRAYQRGTAAEYRAYMEQRYPEAAGMKNPVLVRVRRTNTDAQQFAAASNAPTTMAMSATEQAQNESRQIDRDILGLYRGGEVLSAGNRPMVMAFIQRLPKTEQAAMVNAEGGLSAEGARRFQAALFNRAYGDARMLASLTENTDDDGMAIIGALTTAAPDMARLQDGITRGEISQDTDIAQAIREATAAFRDIRARGMDLRGHMAQQDAFAEPLSPVAQAILEQFWNPAGTRAAGRASVQSFFQAYAQAASEQRTDQATLPGVEPAPLKDARQIIAEITASDAQADPEGGDLFSGTPAPVQSATSAAPATPAPTASTSAPAPAMAAEDADIDLPAWARTEVDADEPAPGFSGLAAQSEERSTFPADKRLSLTGKGVETILRRTVGVQLDAEGTPGRLNSIAARILNWLTDNYQTADPDLVRQMQAIYPAIERMADSATVGKIEKGPSYIASDVPAWAVDFTRNMMQAAGSDTRVTFYTPDSLPKDHIFRKANPQMLTKMKQGKTLGMVTGVRNQITGESHVLMILSPRELRPSTASLETLAHELGHIIQAEKFDTLPVRDKLDILAEYANWLANTRPGNHHMSRSSERFLKRAFRRQNVQPGGLPQSNAPSAYAEGFDEWFADNTARIFSTNKVGISTIDRFFARLAKMWRAIAAALRAEGYNPPVLEKFYNDAMKHAIDRARNGSPAMLDSPAANYDPTPPDVSDPDVFALDDDLPLPAEDPSDVDTGRPEPDLDLDADVDADVETTDVPADLAPLDGDMEDAQTRAPRGGSTPNMANVSFTEKNSIYEGAFRDAGLDPDEARLMPANRQVAVLANLIQNRFGMRVEVQGGVKGIDAVNQLLDAYRNMMFMMHTLGLPEQALSLGGTLSLTLERASRRYLGVYRPDTRTIGMPGRSNSFAHEWAHALDHFLGDTLQNIDTMLSRITRGAGIDPLKSLDAAFINLLHTMLFDDAALASKMLDLERAAGATIQKGPDAGKPTQAALKAQEQLRRLVSGATRIPIQPSAYAADSRAYSPSQAGYYGSIHEMLARAFEAYIASKVENAGGTTEFITKGDRAYLSDADRRLAMTFPKASDRARIFSAFDAVFDHVRAQQVLGSGPAAAKPDNRDVMDPMMWAKAAAAEGELGLAEAIAEDLRRMTNAVKSALTKPGAALRGTVSGLALGMGISKDQTPGSWAKLASRNMGDAASSLFNSLRGHAKRLVARSNPDAQAFFNFALDRIMTDPGTGRDQSGSPITFEEARERAVNKAATTISNMLKTLKLGKAFNGYQLPDADAAVVRSLMLGKPARGAKPELVKFAAGLRRIMNDAYTNAVNAGITMGYVSNTGYLPRVLVKNRVHQDPEGFLAAAKRVYRIVFDDITSTMDDADLNRLATSVAIRSEPSVANPLDTRIGKHIKTFRAASKAARNAKKADDANTSAATQAALQQAIDNLVAARDALLDAIREPYAQTSAQAWSEGVRVGSTLTFDSLGPDASFAQMRSLPPEADTIMEAFYETDPILSALNYVNSTTARAAYQERFGLTSGNQDLNDILRREDVQNAMRKNPSKYNPNTPKGRLAILTDLANHKTDNLLQMAMTEVARAGGETDDIASIRAIIEDVTGRNSGAGNPHADRISAALYVLGYITFLPRTAFTAVMEPAAIMMRTRDWKAGVRTLGFYLAEAARGTTRTQDLARLAEMIGVVSTPLHDTVMLNRMSGDFGNAVEGNTLTANFFRANWLSQLTNAQRRASLAAGMYWMRDLAAVYNDAGTTPARKRMVAAEFNDLGIPPSEHAAIADFLASGTGILSLDDLKTPVGAMVADAAARLVDQTIQNPRRADKPMAAASPIGRVAYSLMSFLYTFYRNVHLATINRAKRNFNIAREEGGTTAQAAGAAGMDAAWGLGIGFLTMFTGQLLVTVAREALFNPEQWEEKEEEGDLRSWLTWLAVSRTGVAGPADVILNSVTGLRYERDLANLFIGAYPAFILSSVQNMIKGLPNTEVGPYGVGLRNSDNTNTAERTAAKSFYRLMVAPAASILLSAVPVAGPISGLARYSALVSTSSAGMASGFADTVVGPQE
jgi:hypothetical protein